MAFAVSSVVAAVGAVASVGGTALSFYNSEKAASANADAAQQQAKIAALQAGNVDVEKQQLQLQTQQQNLQTKTNTAVIQDQAQADAIRQQAAELDATRQKRQAVRNGIVARANSLTAATNQGASAPGSTALKQSSADITASTDTNILGVNQNLEVGTQLYDINKSITQQYLNAQQQNSSYVNASAQLQSQELDTQKQIYSLGGTASNDYASAALYSGNAAIGQGLASLGNSVVNSYTNINKLTNYFGSKMSTS
jgi:hypothetical protein